MQQTGGWLFIGILQVLEAISSASVETVSSDSIQIIDSATTTSSAADTASPAPSSNKAAPPGGKHKASSTASSSSNDVSEHNSYSVVCKHWISILVWICEVYEWITGLRPLSDCQILY